MKTLFIITTTEDCKSSTDIKLTYGMKKLLKELQNIILNSDCSEAYKQNYLLYVTESNIKRVMERGEPFSIALEKPTRINYIWINVHEADHNIIDTIIADKQHTPMTNPIVSEVIEKLSDIEVDGETLEYIIRELGMEDQIQKQFNGKLSDIIITVEGGVIDDIKNIPEKIYVIVRDFDTDGIDEDRLTTFEGEDCLESVWGGGQG